MVDHINQRVVLLNQGKIVSDQPRGQYDLAHFRELIQEMQALKSATDTLAEAAEIVEAASEKPDALLEIHIEDDS